MLDTSMAIHTSPEDIAKNPYGRGTFNANPDWHSAAVYGVKCDLTDIEVDLNDLLGAGKGHHRTPEELLDVLARDVLSLSGHLDPATGESTHPDLSVDKVKRLILLCALTPDDLLSDSEMVSRYKDIRDTLRKQHNDERVNAIIKHDDERTQASS